MNRPEGPEGPARANIVAAGVIPTQDIDVFDVRNATPTPSQLPDYGAVLVWTNNFPQDPEAFGNVLAD